jgi:precorrin-3B methylase
VALGLSSLSVLNAQDTTPVQEPQHQVQLAEATVVTGVSEFAVELAPQAEEVAEEQVNVEEEHPKKKKRLEKKRRLKKKAHVSAGDDSDELVDSD